MKKEQLRAEKLIQKNIQVDTEKAVGGQRPIDERATTKVTA
jgi:hypothetical protein